MAVGDVFRHFKPQLGQLDFFGTVNFDQPIPLHPGHSRVNDRRAGVETVGLSHRFCLFTVALEFIKHQQIFLDDLRRTFYHIVTIKMHIDKDFNTWKKRVQPMSGQMKIQSGAFPFLRFQ